MPGSVVSEFIELESRLDNAIMFTVVQELHAIALRYVENSELVAMGLVASGVFTVLNQTMQAAHGSHVLLQRLLLLLAGQAVADMIRRTSEHANSGQNVFLLVQTITVLSSVLILASAISPELGGYNILVQRGLTVTTYIFADTIGEVVNEYDFGISPLLIGLLCVCVLQSWNKMFLRWTTLSNVMHGLNVVVVNVLLESMAKGRDSYTQIFILILLVLMIDAINHAGSVVESVKDYAVWAAARKIGRLVSASALSSFSSELSPVVLILVIAFKHLARLDDSVLVHLTMLVATNDVITSATRFVTQTHGFDQLLLLFLYVLLLDTVRNIAVGGVSNLRR